MSAIGWSSAPWPNGDRELRQPLQADRAPTAAMPDASVLGVPRVTPALGRRLRIERALRHRVAATDTVAVAVAVTTAAAASPAPT
ncbi:MAG: hypothetical protein QM626_05900, partial [Microbacterium sp.]|uniref:hypothetical protein n=1 Tax=Microbacterium sp. TaxID=51671 RepID=UPI0039E243D0